MINREILNSDLLKEDIIPKIVSREEQIKEIKFNMFLSNKPDIFSMYWYGGSGSGKTAVYKEFLKKAIEDYLQKERDGGISQVYINCIQANNMYKIISEIAVQLKCNKNLQSIYDYISSNNKLFLLVLDEINSIVSDDELNRVVYIITNMNDQLKATSKEKVLSRVRYILITNDVLVSHRFKMDVLSRLTGDKIKFEEYTAEDIYEILKTRMDSIKELKDNDILRMVANTSYAYFKGDARNAIRLLIRAIKISILQEHPTILESDVYAAVSKLKEDISKDKMMSIGNIERNILSIINALNNQNIFEIRLDELSKMYEERFSQKVFVSTISNLLNNLKMRGFIDKKITSNKQKGRTSVITISEEIKDYIPDIGLINQQED